MSGEAIVRFLMTEAILALVMLLAVWGIKKIGWDAEPTKIAVMICFVLFGGLMLIVLLRFIGIF